MKLFGSLSEIVNLIFRKDSQQITVRPSQSVTYVTTTDVQLAPSTAATQVLVSEAATQTLTNKSINGDNNTLSNVAITSLKTGGSQYDVLLRDGSGAVVNGRLTNDSIATGAAIALTKLATVTANRALQSDGSGNISASSITATELGHLSGVTSNIQTQLDNKVDENPAIVGATATKITFDSKGLVTAGTALAAGDMPSGIDATRIGAGSVDNTEFGYLNGLTSSAVGVSDSQVLLNKTISSTSLITGALTLPVGTQAQRPGSPVDGMVRYNSDSGSFEGRANGTWSGIGGGGTTDIITQASHGFVIGDVLYLNGSVYTKAIATAANTAEVVGMVSRVISATQFELTLSGEVSGLTGLTAGEVYFLSAATAGALTVTEPTVVGQVSIPVGVASSTTTMYVAPKRGSVVGSSNARTQIPLANNTTNTVQSVSAYDAGELTGWVSITATTPLRFYVSVKFSKNGAGTDYNLSYQTSGDTPPAGFLIQVTAAGVIQAVLPNITGFASASINYALNAPAVGTSFPLSVNATSIVGSFSNITTSDILLNKITANTIAQTANNSASWVNFIQISSTQGVLGVTAIQGGTVGWGNRSMIVSWTGTAISSTNIHSQIAGGYIMSTEFQISGGFIQVRNNPGYSGVTYWYANNGIALASI